MKNIEKWVKTEKVIFELSNDVLIGSDAKELIRRLAKMPCIDAKSSDITLMIKDVSLIFFSDKLGNYSVPMFIKRMRLNVVPLCFLVESYNQQIKVLNMPNAKVIPFDLKAFWKMSTALELVGDLSHMLMTQKLFLQKLRNEQIPENRKKKIEDALKLVESLKILQPKDGKIEIQYLKSKFIVNTNNVKLNIIPLCKILVQYYIQYVIYMDNIYKSIDNYWFKEKIYGSWRDTINFMKTYFG